MPLVGVRQEVVAEAEHAFGNLFHRLHYLAQKLHGQGVEGAASLEGGISELEDLLRLVLDYTSPLAVEVQEVGSATVLGGMASGLACRVLPPDGEAESRPVLVDPRHLSEAFRLMREGLGAGESAAAGATAAARIEVEEPSLWLRVDGFEPGRNGIARGRGLVAWALAQKLIEAQGGTLVGEAEDGGVRWSVRLPLPAERA